MALPKLNVTTYELELPSTGETIKYRPFLVKEQKLLMVAQESEEDKQLENAFATIIKDCTFGEIDPYEIPLFDVEYIFLRLRGKSVGEKITLSVLCPDDEKTRVDVDIDLTEVGVQMNKEHTNEIQLTDDIKLVMTYPKLDQMSKFEGDTSETTTIFEMLKDCIKEIHSGDEIYNAVDVSSKELDEFLDSMSTQNFEEVGNFFITMPKLQHVIKVKNPKTKKIGEVNIQGMQSFFE